MSPSNRKPQVCVLGSAEPGSRAYDLAGEAGAALARLGITVVSGCGSPATRVAAERALQANGLVLSIIPPDQMPPPEWPASVVTVDPDHTHPSFEVDRARVHVARYLQEDHWQHRDRYGREERHGRCDHRYRHDRPGP